MGTEKQNASLFFMRKSTKQHAKFSKYDFEAGPVMLEVLKYLLREQDFRFDKCVLSHGGFVIFGYYRCVDMRKGSLEARP